ncbi:DUF4097 family beta strand repeat protein [Streptomyces sp. AV19]|uniref:DUF4097 family beta strand repeat-containing protein n=1 Tax=Streptomyces sp. AV19 TaxID=2793068 RepID=UPI0018FE5EC1|nr:DUF4097 family beta strand repeat-containing protein [Streptomyces sp. AV19]MBH1938200.1 DUF4097 family beta strand repeat protein [Streptomyces sp. AV19]MDG4534839.1 DUF4097 domain-containing protein [Streptomyces sp. AV19]
MRRTVRLLTALVATGTAVAGLSACDGLTPGKTFQDDATPSEKVTSVRVDNNSGGVRVRGKAGLDRAVVHREVEYRDGHRPEGATHRFENGTLVLADCGDECSVSYTVDVPAGTPVTGENSSGEVKLSDVGAVRVTTHSGAIELDGVSGDVTVGASSGRIRGRGLRGGAIRATTSSGEIDLTAAVPQDVTARTSSGRLVLTVPDARYRVSARTSSGGKDIGVSQDPAGKYRLDLTTTSGEIKVGQG